MSYKPFSRTVQSLGPGCVGVSIPKEIADEYGIEPGDELPVEPLREEDRLSFLLSD